MYIKVFLAMAICSSRATETRKHGGADLEMAGVDCAVAITI